MSVKILKKKKKIFRFDDIKKEKRKNFYFF
jgi:hypothetical protein